MEMKDFEGMTFTKVEHNPGKTDTIIFTSELGNKYIMEGDDD